jgi:hypothetical protein
MQLCHWTAELLRLLAEVIRVQMGKGVETELGDLQRENGCLCLESPMDSGKGSPHPTIVQHKTSMTFTTEQFTHYTNIEGFLKNSINLQ